MDTEKDALISHYVNLYRMVNWSNEGLQSDELEKMSINELKNGIDSLMIQNNINNHYSNY